MRISDWSSDVCSSDLRVEAAKIVVSVCSLDHGHPSIANADVVCKHLAGLIQIDRFRDPLLDYKSVRGDFRFNTLVEGGKPGTRICGAEPDDIFVRRPEEAVGKIHRHDTGNIEPTIRPIGVTSGRASGRAR